MKKIFKIFEDKANKLYINALVKKNQVKNCLTNEDGGMQLDNGWAIIIGIIVAGILLAGIIWLFNDVIFPQVKSSTEDMFAKADGKGFVEP